MMSRQGLASLEESRIEPCGAGFEPSKTDSQTAEKFSLHDAFEVHQRRNMAERIKAGDKFPNTELRIHDGEKPNPVKTHDLLTGKTVCILRTLISHEILHFLFMLYLLVSVSPASVDV
jgi:hypothetical protein